MKLKQLCWGGGGIGFALESLEHYRELLLTVKQSNVTIEMKCDSISRTRMEPCLCAFQLLAKMPRRRLIVVSFDSGFCLFLHCA